MEEVAHRFRLLGEPARLRLLHALQPGERTVNDLTAALGANQGNVSRHLAALAGGGLVKRRRDGNSVYYSIADPVVFKLCDLVCRTTKRQVRMRAGALLGRTDEV